MTSTYCTVCGGDFPEDKPIFDGQTQNKHGNCKRIQERILIPDIPKFIPTNK